MFQDRKLIIATKHGKEQVIAPILEQGLGVKCIVDPNFDTDVFGTFTGEVERIEDTVTTARNKCIKAMEVSGCTLAIASEGSFGPHPTLFFLPADEELLIFMDKKNELEIIVRELSTNTNFMSQEVHSEMELRELASLALFPSHGLILRKNKQDFNNLRKGILDWETLLESYQQLNDGGGVYLETDMRASHNPSRMKVIEMATRKMINKINSHCPRCGTPGFDITDAKRGLPCELCDFPTRSVLSYIHSCRKCGMVKEETYPYNKMKEDPKHCDICNP